MKVASAKGARQKQLAQALGDAIASALIPEERARRLAKARGLGPNPSKKAVLALLLEFTGITELPPLTKKFNVLNPLHTPTPIVDKDFDDRKALELAAEKRSKRVRKRLGLI